MMTLHDPRLFDNADGVIAAIRRAQKHFAPPPDLKPSEWAERNVRIPIGNAIPGLIRFDNAPYQREPIDMAVHPECHRISLDWGAQTGKTTVILVIEGYHIDVDPCSQIMMQPSQGDLQTWLETKFEPMVAANPRLQSLIAKPRGREGVNNQRMKSYPGGFLMFSWAGSPKTMRGRSAPKIFADEPDGYDRTNEGHPVNLIRKRNSTFGDAALLVESSTPTIKGASYIEDAYKEGDQRQFWVPCHDCGETQVLEWKQVIWDKDADGVHLPETAHYVCKHCGSVWSDGQRHANVRRAERAGGGWVAKKPFRGHASFHLNELYSTMRYMRDIVQSFLDALASDDLQTFINTSLAETYEEEGKEADSAALMARAESYPAEVPQGALVLTMGVDMQEDRLEAEVVGWGLGEESWSIDYQIFWGDPMEDDVWHELDEYRRQTWVHQSGAVLGISATGIDTGGGKRNVQDQVGFTQRAYEYCSTRFQSRVYALKGFGGFDKPIVGTISKKKLARFERIVRLFPVGVDPAKLVVVNRANIDKPGPGYCHFPEDREPEWFEQFTAEKLITRISRGYITREWHKRRPRNEGFDCRVYAYAALKIRAPNLKSLFKKLQPEKPENEIGPQDKAEPDRQVSKKGKRRARKAGGIKGV